MKWFPRRRQVTDTSCMVTMNDWPLLTEIVRLRNTLAVIESERDAVQNDLRDALTMIKQMKSTEVVLLRVLLETTKCLAIAKDVADVLTEERDHAADAATLARAEFESLKELHSLKCVALGEANMALAKMPEHVVTLGLVDDLIADLRETATRGVGRSSGRVSIDAATWDDLTEVWSTRIH